MRTDDDQSGSYRHDFATRPDEVATHTFALEHFEFYRRGTHLVDAPPLAPTTIRSVGILISEGQEGPFALEIRRISAG